MAGEFGLVFVLFVVLALLGPLVLYALVSAETNDLPVMDRDSAERIARRDVDDESRVEREDGSD
ncbi:hypothetical protein [Halogranum rubrum]|uniref:Uncharacterized protein n=1 Tax=Halogranum salarium B-1 TaxID=1210908 RepID=J3JD02_9EURY|nr:hypothetical protein [Halogranum salarium]EJN57061.1 hypothetical protein HSB1_44470 [Halogranum salarium B-1]